MPSPAAVLVLLVLAGASAVAVTHEAAPGWTVPVVLAGLLTRSLASIRSRRLRLRTPSS